MMTSVKKKGILGFIFLGVLISVWWSFSADHLFCFDDSELLARASLHSYGELFSFYGAAWIILFKTKAYYGMNRRRKVGNNAQYGVSGFQ